MFSGEDFSNDGIVPEVKDEFYGVHGDCGVFEHAFVWRRNWKGLEVSDECRNSHRKAVGSLKKRERVLFIFLTHPPCGGVRSTSLMTKCRLFFLVVPCIMERLFGLTPFFDDTKLV